MSAVFIILPVVVTNWPVISAAVAAAAATMGLNLTNETAESRAEAAQARKTQRVDQLTHVELRLEASEIVEEHLATGRRIVLTQGDLRIVIQRNEQGRLHFCVDGINRTTQELEAFGVKVMDKVTQIYVYNRIMTELKQRNLEVVRQEVDQEDTVRLYVYNAIG